MSEKTIFKLAAGVLLPPLIAMLVYATLFWATQTIKLLEDLKWMGVIG